MDRTYQLCVCDSLIPGNGSPFAEWIYGHKNKGNLQNFVFIYVLSCDLHQLWDVYTHANCLRTFHGHGKAVKDVTFSNDGRRFLSCGYDRYMKLWDTETGQCLQRFNNGKIPYVVRFHPDEDKQNTFLAGMSDKKIIQV